MIATVKGPEAIRAIFAALAGCEGAKGAAGRGREPTGPAVVLGAFLRRRHPSGPAACSGRESLDTLVVRSVPRGRGAAAEGTGGGG